MKTDYIRGFTIIELLIVIVVIGILASISVATYGGIRERADDSLIASKVQSIAKIIETYGAANGGYVPMADWVCVGESSDFPAGNGYNADWCTKPFTPDPIPGGWVHPIDQNVNAKFKTLINRMPDSKIPEVVDDQGYTWRGIVYDSSTGWNGGKPVLDFMIRGDRSACPIGEKLYSGPTYTRCHYNFTTVTSESGS
jgi:prepilin-type N-terminal cleavage/methylation domain-containing protein